jgi:hypothetical protein
MIFNETPTSSVSPKDRFGCKNNPGGIFMLTAIALVCALGTPPSDCNRDTALAVVHAPEQYSTPTAWLIDGQAFLAGSPFGPPIDPTKE